MPQFIPSAWRVVGTALPSDKVRQNEPFTKFSQFCDVVEVAIIHKNLAKFGYKTHKI
jgi:hypothetical protein